MFNNKIIRIFYFTICIIIVFSMTLVGCSKDDPAVSYPEDISDVVGFKCVCSTDHKTEFVIENDDAKVLYTYIKNQWKHAEESEPYHTKQACIHLSFQDGEPLLILNREANLNNSNNFVKAEQNFYGVFWIQENDYMVYTAMPMTSFQKYYKLPEGTYSKVLSMIAK